MQINVLYLIKSYKIQYDHYAGLTYNIAHNGPTRIEFGWEFLVMLLILKQSYAAN